MDVLRLSKYNDALLKVECDPSVGQEISEYFTFAVPGARFTPAYRNKVWDGKIRLFNTLRQTLYFGLVEYVYKFAEERDYKVEFTNPEDFEDTPFTNEQAEKFIKQLNLPFAPRDYQVDTFVHAIQKRRALLLSPTASGKSLIIYLIARYLSPEGKMLLIVPTVSLVHQMASDFISYGCPPEMIHKILAGGEKQSDAPFVISTWQSVYQLPRSWYDQYNIVMGDEAHLFKAKSLTSVMEKMINCKYRFGLTGTLDGTQTHKLVLEGLFGKVRKVTSTAELIEQKHLAEFKIKAIVLNYDDETRKMIRSFSYQDEVGFLLSCANRNTFISKLTSTLKGNTLVLFHIIAHGKKLFQEIEARMPGSKVFFVHGEITGDERENIRHFTEKNDNVVIVASYGTFSTGVNIKNLHNVVFASPSKSRIRNLQSIGRGLRKSDQKTAAVLYDISDDLAWKSRKNFTLLHFGERIKIYNEEKFEYKIFTVPIKGAL